MVISVSSAYLNNGVPAEGASVTCWIRIKWPKGGYRVTEFYRSLLGAIISNKGSKPGILSRIAQTTAALSRLRSYGGTRTSHLLLRLSWCGRSSYLPSFMPMRAGPWQQKSTEGTKPSRWDAIGDFWTFPTKTMWRTRRFATESRMQLECTMIF